MIANPGTREGVDNQAVRGHERSLAGGMKRIERRSMVALSLVQDVMP